MYAARMRRHDESARFRVEQIARPTEGAPAQLPLNLDEYEALAATRLEPGALAYFAGGANDEVSLADNRAAFRRRRIVPRVLRGIEAVDTSTEVLGRRWPHPIWIAPTALHRLAHPDGELATARAAASRGVTMALSSLSSVLLGEVAAVGGPRWYQVYLLVDRGASREMVERAVAAGYEALVFTVDLVRLGRRERDFRDGFVRPPNMHYANIQAVTGDDTAAEFKTDLDWRDVEWLAGFGLPVIVKGILHPADARLAIAHGAAGIDVSNHGGRQLDLAIASLEALEPIVEVVEAEVPVLIDGGVRRGSDVLMAMALGASAVGIGRPVLWGLACDGEPGVGRVLDLLAEEFELAMALAGAASIGELRPDLVVRAG